MSHALLQWLEQRAPRERQLLFLSAAILVLALLWSFAIAPALHTYRISSEAHAKLDAELAAMQAMAAQAKQIQALPTVSANEAQTWLEGSIKKLGRATLTVQGARVQINFAGADAQALATWLTEARTSAQLLPVQANWRRAPGSPHSAEALWDGAIVVELPSK